VADNKTGGHKPAGRAPEITSLEGESVANGTVNNRLGVTRTP